jgi:uncharacterized protein YbcI
MAAPDLQPATNGRLNAAIANAVVGVRTRRVGRGPTKVRTFCRDNVVVLVMHDTLTRSERSLADLGQEDAAREMRRQLDEAMRAELIAAVEGLTGRLVVAFLTDSQITPDVSAQLFVLDGALDGAG